MLKVVYDDVIFKRQRYGGISEFWKKLTGAVARLKAVQCEWERSFPFALLIPSLAPNSVFHSSYYRYSWGRHSKTVTTVHDLIHERGLNSSISQLRADAFVYLKRRALAKSSVVVCVSYATASDFKEFYPEIASQVPVQVIHHGPTIDDVRETGDESSPLNLALPADPYLLFVGSRSGYKNFSLLLEALSEPELRRHEVRLLVVGKPFAYTELARIAELRLDRVINNVGHVNNRLLALLYRKAAALAYPSAYEGFGLPVLDAMYVGCPVVVARIASLSEVAGRAAVYFETNNAESLSSAILQALSPGKRAELKKEGPRRSSTFSWHQAAAAYVSCYQLAASLGTP